MMRRLWYRLRHTWDLLRIRLGWCGVKHIHGARRCPCCGGELVAYGHTCGACNTYNDGIRAVRRRPGAASTIPGVWAPHRRNGRP